MLEKLVEEMLYYGKYHLDLSDYDIMYTRNILLHELSLSEPYDKNDIDYKFIESLDTADYLVNKLYDLVPNITDHEIEKLMSIISPKPSEIIKKFNELKVKDTKLACDYFYNLCIKNNYIRLTDIRRNLKWEYSGENNILEITINLSKPEKDNKDIAKVKTMISTSYPKCRLCISNEGFYGGGDYPARSNIRLIPMNINNENWYMQYSPYAYYDEHIILINENHIPMNITNKTIKNELAFVDQIPNYFIGSNSDLHIVGGSLLQHEHFQGGSHIMPMMMARDRYKIVKKDALDVEISYLDWYNSCMLLKSKNKESILKVTDKIIDGFYNYSDESIELINKTGDTRHNAITSISRKVDDKYYVYLIFRNNRCNDTHPDGIFHAHKEYHNIKKEGIGLIEAMGLYILPGRLKKEIDEIADILSNSIDSLSSIIIEHPELEKHLDFINKLIYKYQRHNSKDAAIELIRFEIGKVCEQILKNTGIFKDTLDGQIALKKFINYLDMEVKQDE